MGMKVREAVEVILALNGGRKFENTCDRLIAGNWDYRVTGVVTTFMSTVEVIQRSIGTGCNLIITHEPTYFTGSDRLDWLKADSVYRQKKALLDDNRISIWRYHDHMHSGNTDLIYAGLLKELGWEKYRNPEFPLPHCYSIPSTRVVDLVDFLRKKLGMNIIRVVGKLDMECSRVGILVGGGSLGLGQEEMPAALMEEQKLDVMICGEITEWTLSAYVRDAAALGFNKAMIIIGHERSEEPGMKELASRLTPLLQGIPVHFLDAGEPFVYI
jgi:putative NIF3 family GTP cyclohydrolase 1 type 2